MKKQIDYSITPAGTEALIISPEVIDLSNLYPAGQKPAYIKKEQISISKINQPDITGLTLLHHAAKAGDRELVKLLLENSAQINLITGYRPEFGLKNTTALGLVLEEINKSFFLQNKTSLEEMQDILLDYGADAAPIGNIIRNQAKEEKLQDKLGLSLAAEKKQKANYRAVKDCADGDRDLEGIYLNFYNFLQSRLNSVMIGLQSAASGKVEFTKEIGFGDKLVLKITEKSLQLVPVVGGTLSSIVTEQYQSYLAGKQFAALKEQASHFTSNAQMDEIARDFAARVIGYYKEDIVTLDLDLEHKQQFEADKLVQQAKMTAISGFTGISRSELKAYYVKEGENILRPHWEQIAAKAVVKFLHYLASHNVSYSPDLGIKAAESFLPAFSNGALKLKAGDSFTLDNAKSLGQVVQLAYESMEKIKSVAKSWGFKDIYLRQSDLFKSFVMHDDENMIIGFRGTYHNENWLNNIHILEQEVRVKGKVLTVHKGFYDALMTHWGQENGDEKPLKERVEEILRSRPHLKIFL
jgi:hypothetical protein